MKRVLPSFFISFLLSIVFLFSGGMRNLAYRFLTLSLYIPLLKVEAQVEEISKLEKERDTLLRENVRLLLELSKCMSGKLDSLWEPGTGGKDVKVLSFDPLGTPLKLFIEGGEREGFKYGDPIIFRSKLVGRISSVFSKTSEVLTVFNPVFKASVVDRRNGLIGVYEGGSPPHLKYIPVDSDIKPGDSLVTSGLGGLFPPGIPVAVVEKVDQIEGQMFLDIKCVPFLDFSVVGRVVVLQK